MASTPLNDDAVTEILLHLPLQSLFRFRAVCKFWRHVIDSPSFRKLHTHNSNNDDTVYLQFTFLDCKLSTKILGNGKPLKFHDNFNDFSAFHRRNPLVMCVGPVKGLVCINSYSEIQQPLVICNPFLGQIQILPIHPSNSCQIFRRDVAIGFDEDYRVVQLLCCREHSRLHAQMYSRRENYWRELAIDHQCLCLVRLERIKSSCKNCSSAHWLGIRCTGGTCEKIIISFDMKNEVFRIITMSDYYQIVMRGGVACKIIAEDEHNSFRLFAFPFPSLSSRTKLVRIYDSVCEGSELSWNHVMNVEEPCFGIPPSLWGSSCVVLKKFDSDKEVIVYDYRAQDIIGRFELPERSEIVEYKGSFVSLEN